jgi:hypothetical protein
MKKFIPYSKLSKRKQRELNQQRRRDWGPLSPVTRKAQNPKAYQRQKTRQGSDDTSLAGFFCIITAIA